MTYHGRHLIPFQAYTTPGMFSNDKKPVVLMLPGFIRGKSASTVNSTTRSATTYTMNLFLRGIPGYS